MENDYEIDLNELDSVRENLNGFWIPENQLDSENIVWLDFDKERNSTFWNSIPYNDEIKRNESIPILSCPTLVALIKLNGETQINFVDMNGSDTSKIEYLTKTKFKIDGELYLRHKGYDFIKYWNRKESESEK